MKLMSTHRDLTPYSLEAAMKAVLEQVPGTLIVTMAIGQWDSLLSEAYNQGWILLELNDDEIPVRAYRKADCLLQEHN